MGNDMDGFVQGFLIESDESLERLDGDPLAAAVPLDLDLNETLLLSI